MTMSQTRLVTYWILLQSSFVGAVAVADMVKTTLGPKGMVCILELLP
jgi:chaperonin GroEL (HSP60 family)